ncbi:MAG: ABC transporter ATP-binding protein [Spirochaetes bacterium]|nr:ABC transporter ATP-binding protein [Spirochaetota bacterium]
MSFIEWRGVTKSFGETTALDAVSLALREGDILAVLGPSGCGKTTFLRATAGLEKPDAGRILCQGQDLAETPPHKRGFGLMFQDYSLFPHLDVAGNVGFGLRMARVPGRRRAERVREMLRLVRLEELSRRSIHELSGGERQRVALARSLAPSPRLLMLDEPLGALDATLRRELLVELSAILRRVGVTAIYVTHDREEALAVADRAAVMREGRIVQAGSPRDLVERPASAFVASFLELGAILDAVPTRRAGKLLYATDVGLLPAAALRGGSATDAGRLLVRHRAVSFTTRRGSAEVRARLTSHTPHPMGILVRLALLGGGGRAHELEVLWKSADRDGQAPRPAARARAVWLDLGQCEMLKG